MIFSRTIKLQPRAGMIAVDGFSGIITVCAIIFVIIAVAHIAREVSFTACITCCEFLAVVTASITHCTVIDVITVIGEYAVSTHTALNSVFIATLTNRIFVDKADIILMFAFPAIGTYKCICFKTGIAIQIIANLRQLVFLTYSAAVAASIRDFLGFLT